MCTFHKFIDCSICVSNSQNSMLALKKGKKCLGKNKSHRKLTTNVLAFLINIFSLGAWYIYG